MIEPTDKYILLSGKLYQVYISPSSGRRVIVHNGDFIWYDQDRDGVPISKSRAVEMFPEMFV